MGLNKTRNKKKNSFEKQKEKGAAGHSQWGM